MKKIFLTAIALLTMATQVFGMYGADSSWIDFLTHGNQFRARINQLGFTLGNDTIKGTFGFHSGANGLHGVYASTDNKTHYNFNPTISMGLAYTSSLISVGVGYNATIGTTKWKKNGGNGKSTEAVVHTPVFVLNALDNAFRMAIPIQVGQHTDKKDNGDKATATAVSLDAQFRYYTGLEIVPQLRLRLWYGNYSSEQTTGSEKTKNTIAESFGFHFRLYFGSVVEEVALNPIIKIEYKTALGKQHNQKKVVATDVINNLDPWSASGSSVAAWNKSPSSYGSRYGTHTWDLIITPALGLTANSDIVSLYLEPSLGFQVLQDGDNTQKNVKEAFKLAYDVYAEIYLRPLQNLEWYFETSIGNSGTAEAGLEFALSTGATWYLPQL